MAGGWTRAAIEAHVEALKREHESKAFAAAVERFANESLDPRERELLRELLMERAGVEARHNPDVDRRLKEGGWFRRQLRRLEESAERPGRGDTR